MKVYQTSEIKNIAILGSSGSGKTTLVEAMLFESGVIKRRGSISAKIQYPIFLQSRKNMDIPYHPVSFL